jgi:hypothetical protein
VISRMCNEGQGGGDVPFTCGVDATLASRSFGASESESSHDEESCSSGVLLPDEVSASSGMVANRWSTCFKAGRRIGLLKK